MIKFKFKQKKKSSDSYSKSYLVVNGIEDRDSFALIAKGEKPCVHFYSERVIQILLEESISELKRNFDSVDISYRVEWNDLLDSVSLEFKTNFFRKYPSIDLELYLDWERWAKPYSIAEYAEVFERVTKNRRRKGVVYFQSDELVSAGFGLRFRYFSENLKFIEEVERCVNELKDVCEDVEKILIAAARKNSLITFFSFPPSIKASCEQYLIYFVQFLDDLGIKADAELKNDAHRVLFSVTPLDGRSALIKIREALDVYLRLVEMSDFSELAPVPQNVAVQQLRANVLHLQSQLTLAQAVHAAKDATIEALSASNFQYRQLISSEKKSGKNSEALIGDTIHLTEVEAKGVRVDLPLILRRLKRRFSGEA